MKKALTTRQKTVQMLLERWREKQEAKEVLTATPLYAQKPRMGTNKARRHGNQLKID